MISFHHHAKKVVDHIGKHHQKYLLLSGIAGGFLVGAKLVLFFATSFMIYSDQSFADDAVLTGDALTGTVLTGEILTGDALTGDTLTGTVLTGEILTGTVSTGEVLTGNILTGDVLTGTVSTGNNLTGTVSTGTVLTGTINTGTEQTGTFQQVVSTPQTGLNISNYVTGITLSSSGMSTGYLPIGAVIKFSFQSTGSLTGISVIINSGNAIFQNKSGTNYDYAIMLTGGMLSGVVPYKISFSDIYGNTGLLTGISAFVFDNVYPLITGLVITGNNTGMLISYKTLENVRSTIFSTVHGVSTGQLLYSSIYQTGHSFVLNNFSTGSLYDMGISLLDQAGNVTKYAFSLGFTGVLNTGYYNLIAIIRGLDVQYMNTGTALTGTINTGSNVVTGVSILSGVKQALNNFNACKEDIDYTQIKLQIKGNEFKLAMPNFKKSDIKKIINTFSYYIVQKLSDSSSIDQKELTDITEKFDSFLVILKLVKDDNNSCKQNLSNYHIRQFKDTLKMYGFKDF